MPKGRLKKRIAKATGTTVGEAAGTIRNARQAVKAGNSKKARKTISKALKGGPTGGVPRSPARTAKARKTARKVVKRMSENQGRRVGRNTSPGTPRKVGARRTKGDVTMPIATDGKTPRKIPQNKKRRGNY